MSINLFLDNGRRKYRWPQERLEKLAYYWNTLSSIDEVCKKMEDIYSAVTAQATQLKRMGVPMRRFRPMPIDYDRIKRIAEKALKKHR